MKGKAALFVGIREPFEITDYDLPDVEEKASIIAVTQANICGSDIHMWRGESPFPFGMVGGHEMTGKILKLGSDLKTDGTGKPLNEGDRVVYPYFMFCGACRACLHDRRTACQNKLRYWTTKAEKPPHFRGAYAEYYYSPPGNPIYKVPDTLNDDMVAAANCALSQVIYGLYEASMKVGDYVVVQGAGGLGIYCTAVAKAMGARAVIVLDLNAERLDLAKNFGADEILNVSEFKDSKELIAGVRERTEGQGADVVMGLAGVPSVIPEALRMLAPGGRMVEIGNISLGETVPIDPGYLVVRGLTLKTVICYEPWALAASLDFLERNRDKYPFERILSHQFPFEQINEAFSKADRGEVIRASLVFKS
jgi:threonine dehydrogenase-like Zn-dependent dehydrogenase